MSLTRDGTSSAFIEIIQWMRLTDMDCRLAATKHPRQYEFPTGYNATFGIERFLIGEQMFVHSQNMVVSCSPTFMDPEDELIFAALAIQSEYSSDATNAHRAITDCLRARPAHHFACEHRPLRGRQSPRRTYRPPPQRASQEFLACQSFVRPPFFIWDL